MSTTLPAAARREHAPGGGGQPVLEGRRRESVLPEGDGDGRMQVFVLESSYPGRRRPKRRRSSLSVTRASTRRAASPAWAAATVPMTPSSSAAASKSTRPAHTGRRPSRFPLPSRPEAPRAAGRSASRLRRLRRPAGPRSSQAAISAVRRIESASSPGFSVIALDAVEVVVGWFRCVSGCYWTMVRRTNQRQTRFVLLLIITVKLFVNRKSKLLVPVSYPAIFFPVASTCTCRINL